MAAKNNGGTIEAPAASPVETSGQQVLQPPTVQGFTPPTEVKKFRLEAGQHEGYNKNAESRLWRRGEIIECYHVDFYPQTNDEVVNQVPRRVKSMRPFDLAKRFNQPDSIKFTAVPPDVPTSKGLRMDQGNPVMDDEDQAIFDTAEAKLNKGSVTRNDGTDDIYDAMSLDDLKSYAAENEIDLGEARSREATLEVIRKYEAFMTTH